MTGEGRVGAQSRHVEPIDRDGTGRHGRFWTAVTGALCAITSGLLVIDYTLIHFYRRGAFFWDSGMYAYFMSFADRWPLRHPPVADSPAHDTSLGYSYFSIHIDPIFYLTSALNAVLDIPPAAFFSLTQGVWFAILAGTCFAFSSRSTTHVTPITLIVSALLALSTSFSGPLLGMLGFPHFEVAIPALLLSFLYLWAAGRSRLAFIVLGLSLLVREDAGFHGGILLALLALSWWHTGRPAGQVKTLALAAAACLLYSAVVFVLQSLLYKGEFSYFNHVYAGTPLLSHVTWRFIGDRLSAFAIDKAYITWPTLLVLGVALWKREWSLAIGPIAIAPWLTLHFLAVSGAGNLDNHYGFPTILAIAWPCANYYLGTRRSAPDWRAASLLQAATSGLSIALFVVLAAGNHDNSPWRGLGVPPLKAIGSYELALKGVLGHRDALGTLLLDDAAVSLVPKEVGPEWSHMWAANRPVYGHALIPCRDTLIRQTGAFDSARSDQIVRECALRLAYRISGTPFVINSRRQLAFPGIEPVTSDRP
jgi:hypothetical protein